MRIFLGFLLAVILIAACGEDDIDFPGSVPDATNTPEGSATATRTATPTPTPEDEV